MSISPESITMIATATMYAVTAILIVAGVLAAIGWMIIATKYLDGISRQPELLAVLRVQVFIVGGLMESFPFIIFAAAMWFAAANPFLASALSAVVGGSGGH